MTSIGEQYTTATYEPTTTRQTRGTKKTSAFDGHLPLANVRQRLKSSGVRGTATVRHWRADNVLVRTFEVRI